mmetsp:Transcript_101382/g.232384  ORF Transcript_101382/g.232384 Transcript_101382/m.232384 type:complete len:353 (+) Transcript_101382:513-1571(+)
MEGVENREDGVGGGDVHVGQPGVGVAIAEGGQNHRGASPLQQLEQPLNTLISVEMLRNTSDHNDSPGISLITNGLGGDLEQAVVLGGAVGRGHSAGCLREGGPVRGLRRSEAGGRRRAVPADHGLLPPRVAGVRARECVAVAGALYVGAQRPLASPPVLALGAVLVSLGSSLAGAHEHQRTPCVSQSHDPLTSVGPHADAPPDCVANSSGERQRPFLLRPEAQRHGHVGDSSSMRWSNGDRLGVGVRGGCGELLLGRGAKEGHDDHSERVCEERVNTAHRRTTVYNAPMGCVGRDTGAQQDSVGGDGTWSRRATHFVNVRDPDCPEDLFQAVRRRSRTTCCHCCHCCDEVAK